ncbi:acyl-CoA synthetase family member 2, mitochondrial [Elysia marginata]|uniref:Acyl-CoA synthetase family member 2, mitochondrial n=1 Tax=Elysia marginata TaxID=1093978 RepID=A0AAV4JNN9_9GAST|nr:acyl-CoA synthetase family member 2, mitochondrial [Elysia marginata]
MDEDKTNNSLNTIPKRLKYIAETYPDREIFICVGKDSRDAFTARSLLNLAGKFAAQLLHNGFKHGDVIANTLPNSPERIITDLGIILAGCIGLNGQILLADGSDFLSAAWKAKCNGIILCPEQWSAAWRLFRNHIADPTVGMFSLVCHEQVPDLTKVVLIRPRQLDM